MDYPGNLFVVAAPSGAGKSSLVKALMELDSRVQPTVSHTTRAPRGQEKHGREYFFASAQEFDAMVLADAFVEWGREAEQAFAELVDYFREYRDCADMYNESGKFEIYDALQAHIDNLLRLQVSLRHAERKVQLKFGSDADVKPMPATILYVVAFPLGQEPSEFATPRTGGLKL